LPVSWRGTVAQYVGRLHRLHEGKREVRVYDYADLNVRMFANMFDRRCRGYESLGYVVLAPGERPAGLADRSAAADRTGMEREHTPPACNG
jgi:superfamily II DNA or RNA helicase